MEVDIPEQYLQLLYEYGVGAKPVPSRSTRVAPLICCNQEATDEHSGHFICWTCGLVKDLYIYRADHYLPSYDNSGRQKNSGTRIIKKRPYLTRIHFWTHYKKYAGVQAPPKGGYPPWLLNALSKFDLNDKDLYAHIKHFLKQAKCSEWYRYIWHLIYTLGGHEPHIDAQQLHQIRQEFLCLEHYFYNVYERGTRHNIKSVSMLLELLLKQVGHEPYYRFPQLKNEQLRHDALVFYDGYCDYLCAERYFKNVEGNA